MSEVEPLAVCNPSCGECGFLNRRVERFCGNCGMALAAAGGGTPPANVPAIALLAGACLLVLAGIVVMTSRREEKAREPLSLAEPIFPKAKPPPRSVPSPDSSVEPSPPASPPSYRLPAVKAGSGEAGIEWVTIPGGSFMMGSDAGSSDERPRHRVSVRTFQMAKTEVTNRQYRACVEAGACTAPDSYQGGDDHPVVNVDWEQARAFSEWAGGRLPSEAEWEYAARSGGRDIEYPWGDENATCARAVMYDGGTGCGMNSTWPVCSKSAGNTRQGLCDMAGNVWEWTQDWYHGSYDGAPTDGRAWESPAGSARVFRGGSWNIGAGIARAANRILGPPGYRAVFLGFRAAR